MFLYFLAILALKGLDCFLQTGLTTCKRAAVVNLVRQLFFVCWSWIPHHVLYHAPGTNTFLCAIFTQRSNWYPEEQVRKKFFWIVTHSFTGIQLAIVASKIGDIEPTGLIVWQKRASIICFFSTGAQRTCSWVQLKVWIGIEQGEFKQIQIFNFLMSKKNASWFVRCKWWCRWMQTLMAEC